VARVNVGDYPADLLAREAAPPYAGEGPFALWHYSEDPGLGTFRPHTPATNPDSPPLVWAVDTRHAPMFWFPRECPRGCVWAMSTTSGEDRDRFFGHSAATRLHVMEASWLGRVRTCELFAYRLPTGPFRPHGSVGGYWVTDETVGALERVAAGDLLGRHADAGIELRITPNLWAFWERVAGSTLGFSGMRMANAAPRLPSP
jgi:uncharacterized protein DUF6886